MANFTQKVGYEGKLDFDPEQGIIKYGNYEKFIYQIPEVKPQTSVVNFASWKQSYIDSITPKTNIMGHMVATRPVKPPSDAELRAIFNSSFKAGPVTDTPPTQNIMGSTIATRPSKGTGFRQVRKLGADSFEVSDYFVPDDVKLLYKMNEYAAGLSQVSEDRALMQEQAQTKQARRINANAGARGNAGAKGGAAAAMLGGSQASRALAGG